MNLPLRVPGTANGGMLPIIPESDSRTEALDTAQQFEQIFVQQMLAGMRKTAQMTGEDEGLFGGGPGSDTYAQWFDSHLADHLRRNGGLGITDTLMREFERWGQIPPAQTDDKSSSGPAPARKNSWSFENSDGRIWNLRSFAKTYSSMKLYFGTSG